MNPAGLGRKPPNQLPDPVRPDDSFNPLRIDKWIKNIIWGRYKFRILAVIICILLLVIIGVILYVVSIFRPFI